MWMILIRTNNKVEIQDDNPYGEKKSKEEEEEEKGWGEEEEKRKEKKLGVFIPPGGQVTFLFGKDTHSVSHECTR